jgi:hypothetical protein
MVDISVFGDTLEIPEEVPTFVREVTPPTLPATGGAVAAPPAAAAATESNVHHGMNRNYDHLFEEEDGDLPMSDNSTAAAGAGGAATGVDIETTKLAQADIFASNPQTVQGRDALQQPPTILPVVVAAPQTTGKKKTRFKVKPSKGKGPTKPGK